MGHRRDEADNEPAEDEQERAGNRQTRGERRDRHR